jgi:hypothetical protein
MLINLLDFSIRVNRHGWRDPPSTTFLKREICAAANDQRRPKQSGGRRPIAEDEHARNDHPDELRNAVIDLRTLTKCLAHPLKRADNTGCSPKLLYLFVIKR